MSKKVKTIEPVREKRLFNNVDEFNKFFNDHQKEFEETTTCKLNKKYEVPGYKITKINGEVSLKNIPESRQTALDKIEQHNNRLATIETTLNTLIQRFNEVVMKVNDALKEVQSMKASIDEQNTIIDHLSQEAKQPEPEHIPARTYVRGSDPGFGSAEPEPTPEPSHQETQEDGPTYRSTGRLNPIAAQWLGLA